MRLKLELTNLDEEGPPRFKWPLHRVALGVAEIGAAFVAGFPSVACHQHCCGSARTYYLRSRTQSKSRADLCLDCDLLCDKKPTFLLHGLATTLRVIMVNAQTIPALPWGASGADASGASGGASSYEPSAPSANALDTQDHASSNAGRVVLPDVGSIIEVMAMPNAVQMVPTLLVTCLIRVILCRSNGR